MQVVIIGASFVMVQSQGIQCRHVAPKVFLQTIRGRGGTGVNKYGTAAFYLPCWQPVGLHQWAFTIDFMLRPMRLLAVFRAILVITGQRLVPSVIAEMLPSYRNQLTAAAR